MSEEQEDLEEQLPECPNCFEPLEENEEPEIIRSNRHYHCPNCGKFFEEDLGEALSPDEQLYQDEYIAELDRERQEAAERERVHLAYLAGELDEDDIEDDEDDEDLEDDEDEDW